MNSKPPSPSRPPVGDPRFWESLYAQQRDRWELGAPAPALVAHLREGPPPKGKVAVLGCGRGHDARLFAQLGYDTWGFDFSETAMLEARRIGGEDSGLLRFEHRDIFTLPAHYPSFFDLVWEYTCFCAIDPRKRPDYVQMVRRILRPDGHLLANFFPVREGTDGPPFPVQRREVERLFGPYFSFLTAYEPSHSAPGRRGLEWFVHAVSQPPVPQTGNLKG